MEMALGDKGMLRLVGTGKGERFWRVTGGQETNRGDGSWRRH